MQCPRALMKYKYKKKIRPIILRRQLRLYSIMPEQTGTREALSATSAAWERCGELAAMVHVQLTLPGNPVRNPPSPVPAMTHAGTQTLGFEETS